MCTPTHHPSREHGAGGGGGDGGGQPSPDALAAAKLNMATCRCDCRGDLTKVSGSIGLQTRVKEEPGTAHATANKEEGQPAQADEQAEGARQAGEPLQQG